MTSVKHIIYFVLITCGMYIGLMFIFSNITFQNKPLIYQTNDFYALKGGATYEQFLTFNESDKYDIIFAGSSKAYKGYDPNIFEENGFKAYNLGSNGQRLENTFQIIKHYVNGDNCKLLVVDLYDKNFFVWTPESSIDLITNVSKYSCAFDVALEMRDSRALNVLLTRMFTNRFGALYEDEHYTSKGFGTTTDNYPLSIQEPISAYDSISDFKPRPIQVISDLIEFTASNNIKLVFAISPGSKFYDHVRHQVFVEKIKPLIEGSHAIFLDYAFSLNLSSEEHFHDPLHLNTSGVQLYNRSLLKDLKAILN